MSKLSKSARETFSNKKIRTLAAVGVFSALAYICCVLFHFKVSFLSFDLKDAVMTIGARGKEQFKSEISKYLLK